MAGVGGYFMQGLASGFAQGQQIQEMNWQRKEKERIKKEEDALLETLTMAGKKFSSYYADYNISEEERLEAITAWSALSYEAKELLKGAYDGVMNYNQEQVDSALKTVKNYRDQVDGLDFDLSSISEISGMFRGQIKSPKELKYYDAMDSIIRKNKEAQQKQPQIERFASPEGVIAKYPDATPEHTTQGWIPKFATDKEGTPLSAKDNMVINDYKAGRINFNQLSKYMGTYITPENATVLEDKIAKAKQYGATNEEIKGMIIGGTGAEEKPRATSLPQLEEYRQKILDTDKWEDSEKIINDYTEAGYDTLQLGVTKEDWTNNKVSDLDNLIAVLNDITAGTPDNRNVKGDKKFSYNIDNKVEEQTGAEWYAQVYESYNALIKILEKQGVDVSKYKKLKPLSEIKKGSAWTSWAVGSGVEAGDLIKIYY